MKVKRGFSTEASIMVRSSGDLNACETLQKKTFFCHLKHFFGTACGMFFCTAFVRWRRRGISPKDRNSFLNK